MAAKQKRAKRKTTHGKAARKKAPARRAGRAKPRPKTKATDRARRPARKAGKPAARAPRSAEKSPPAGSAPVAVTAFSLERIQVEPLRYEAAAALGRLETVQLLSGRSEEGARVETLVFAPSGNAVQCAGEYVHRGQWNGNRLLTEKGHLLDADGACFCRDCETAGGYTLDDDE